MNIAKFQVWLSFIGLIEVTASTSVKDPKMTWANIFKDISAARGSVSNRRQRSELSSEKVSGLDRHYDSDIERGQYILQYLDGYGDSRFADQNRGVEKLNHNLKFVKGEEYEKPSSSEVKAIQPLSLIYTEAAQPVQDPQQFIYLPEKLSAQPYNYATTFQHSAPNSISYHHADNVENNSENYASKYKFGYRVHDPYSGAEFGHSEVSEGQIKKGHYHVLLPDGRLQNVRYWTDPSGYHASVTYEGRAHHYAAQT